MVRKFHRLLCGILVVVCFFNCKTSKNLKSHDILQSTDIILNIQDKENVYAKIISIDSSSYTYSILIEDKNKVKYLAVSKKNYNPVLKINEIDFNDFYNFELIQLTHTNNKADTIEINGQKIVKVPTHYIENCIYFNSERFCSSYYQIYRLINFDKTR